MQTLLCRAVWVMGALTAAALAPDARAQLPGRPPPGLGVQPVFVRVPVLTNIRVQTTVTVPDGGTVLVGGYSRLSEGRSKFGVPVLGRLPVAGRGFRNVGYGRSAVSGRVSASVRIIDLRDEEFRQTGFRSP